MLSIRRDLTPRMTDNKILSSIIVGFHRDVKHKNVTVLIILRLHFDRKQLYLFVFHELVSFEYLFRNRSGS